MLVGTRTPRLVSVFGWSADYRNLAHEIMGGASVVIRGRNQKLVIARGPLESDALDGHRVAGSDLLKRWGVLYPRLEAGEQIVLTRCREPFAVLELAP